MEPQGPATAYLPDSRYELSSSIISHDSYGNPLEVKNLQGPSTVYLWGYGGQYPVAKIENATYAEVQQVLTAAELTALNSHTVSDATINSTVNKLRIHANMSKAQVSTYTYKPLAGMTSMTDPRGITEKYQYDGFQRLKNVLDFENNILKDYRYNYRP